MDIGLFAGELDIFLGRNLHQAVDNIVTDGTGKEYRLLLDDRNILLVALTIERLKVLVAILDRATKRIIKAFDKLNDSRLTASRASNEGNRLVLSNLDRSVIDDRDFFLWRISELDVVESQAAIWERISRNIVTSLNVNRGLVKHDLRNRSHGTKHTDNFGDNGGKHSEVDQDTEQVRIEGIDFTDGEPVIEVQIGRHPDDGIHDAEKDATHHELMKRSQ